MFSFNMVGLAGGLSGDSLVMTFTFSFWSMIQLYNFGILTTAGRPVAFSMPLVASWTLVTKLGIWFVSSRREKCIFSNVCSSMCSMSPFEILNGLSFVFKFIFNFCYSPLPARLPRPPWSSFYLTALIFSLYLFRSLFENLLWLPPNPYRHFGEASGDKLADGSKFIIIKYKNNLNKN